MTTYEKIVKGATKIKVAAPKPKYIEPILLATASKNDFRSVMSALQGRLDDSAWSIVYKALLVIHIMIREGESDVTLRYLSSRQDYFNLHHIKAIGTADARSLLRYAKYIAIRAREYSSTNVDYVRDEQRSNKREGGTLRQLSVDKGLLRQVESVEKQIRGLLNCKFNESEINNEIVLTCFRMLVNDLLCLYQALNEGVINILEHYFEMSKYDAERALEIYKVFVELTTDVVSYLRTAKHLEYATKLHVPTIRHAPTALAKSLEEYLRDENFELNRSQYLAEKEYSSNGSKPMGKTVGTTQQQQQQQQQQQKQQQNQNQHQPVQAQAPIQPLTQTNTVNPWAAQFGQMSLQPLQVQFTQGAQGVTGLQPQHTNNPFLTMQSQPTQTAFPQIHQQQTQQSQPQLQNSGTGFSTVPSSSIVPAFTGAGFGGYTPGTLQQQATGNPFLQQQDAQQASQQQQQQQPQFTQQQTQQQQAEQLPKLVASKTGNNPFSLNYKTNSTGTSAPGGLQPQPTNNPFAATSTVNAEKSQTFTGPVTAQATGTNPFMKQSYTSNRISLPARGTMGGYENLPTQPVFPQTIQEQRTGQYQQQAQWGLQQQLAQQQLAQQQQQQQQQQPQYPQQPQQMYQAYEGPSLI